MNNDRRHLEAEINGKRSKAFSCRKNTMRVESCKDCHLFNDCPILKRTNEMRSHFRKLFKCEPKKY